MKLLQGTISYPEVKWGKPEDRAKNTPLIDIVDEIAGVGADGLELWGRHLDGLSDAQVEALAARIKRSGQKVVVFGAYTDFSSSEDALKSTLDGAARWPGLSKLFGFRLVRIFAGAPASAQATEDHWRRAVGGLKRLAALLKGSGLTCAIETHSEQLADTVPGVTRLVTEAADKCIMINYQAMANDPAKVPSELDPIFKWVVHSHVSLARDWNKCAEVTVSELARRGYNGPVTVEFCTGSLPPEGEAFSRPKAIEGMKRNIADLRKVLSAR